MYNRIGFSIVNQWVIYVQMVGNSSSTAIFFCSACFLGADFFDLISPKSLVSSSETCSSWHPLSKSFSLSLSSSIFLSTSSIDDGARTLKASNWFWTLYGMLNTFCYYFFYWFLFLFFLPFLAGASSST